jgi:hypothetical protein
MCVFLWERHLAAMIVAGAYSAEVAADAAIAAPAATAGLATKAGNHSHKGKNFTLLGAIFLTHTKNLSKESSHFANVPDQSPASATQYFCKNLYRK